jgi:hypothetical protein
LLRNDARTRTFLENYNSGADLAHQVLQNPRLSWRSGLTDRQPSRCQEVEP